MTALAQERMSSIERWTYRQFPLAVGFKAFQNGAACIDLTLGKVVPARLGFDLFPIGKFNETVDATAAELPVNVNLGTEVEVEWWANSGGSITAAMVGQICYLLDDQTVQASPNGASAAGRIWAVDAIKGVAVQKLGGSSTAGGGGAAPLGTLPAYTSNNSNVPTSPDSGLIFDVPTTAAASTITLPATAAEGCILRFVADGTKNGHTVTYRDATGTVALTTALTASKRHFVEAARLNGLWFANAYVSP
jgi:hypothetical protein